MKKCMALLMLLFWSGLLMAQTRSITGKVTDENGAPVAGAAVKLQRSGSTVITDNEGVFNLTVQQGDVLLVSTVNSQPVAIRIDKRSTYTIVLAGSYASLDSVFVTTALGIKRTRNSLPYATQQVSGETLNRTPNTNFINNLSGKVAGLQISASNTLGGTSNVVLRGPKSLTQTNQALFVVDGVPFDNANQSQNGYDLGNVAADINPDDIESVTVLKGAAASALYGSRAANGVIVVNTKKGGHAGKGIGVTLNESIGFGSVDKATLPKYQTQYGQGYGSSGFDPNYPDQSGYFYYTPAIGSNGQPVSVVQTDWDLVQGAAYNPNQLVYNWDAFSPSNANYGKATPWTAAPHHDATDLLVTPVTNITSIYLNGGDAKASFKGGYTNSYNSNILPNSHIKKNTLNFGADYALTDKLSVGGVITYVDENGLNRDSYDFRATNTVIRDFRQWWPTNVDLQAQKDDYFRTRSNVSWNILGGYTTAAADNLPQAAYHNNPYWTLYENYNNDSRKRYFGNVHADYKIASFLTLTGRVSQDNYNQQFETRIATGSYQTASYTKSLASFTETNYDLLLRLDKDLSHTLNLKAILGGNVRKDVNETNYAATNGGLVVPRFYALANSVKTPAAPAETQSTKEVDGVFAGATLSYKQLVTLDGTLRRDQSSTLPKSNNSYYYPALSANFVFSKLLPAYTWLSYAKLRANYAETGNDAPVYSLQNTYTAGTALNGQTLFSYATTNNNPNLVPERNKAYEFGLEAALLKNRISFDVTYYHSRLINQITQINPSAATGFSNFYVNGGTVQNQGVEVSLTAIPVKTRDFSWSITANWSKNNNKVISLYNNQSSYTIASLQNSIQLVAETGKSYGIIRGSDYQYVNGQRLIDANGYPVKSNNTKSDIGNINPDWLGGIANTFTYKNFSLSFLVDIKQGGDLYSLDMDYGAWAGVYAETAGTNDLGNPLRNPLSNGGGVILQGVTNDGKPNTKRVDASDINKDGNNFPFSSVKALAASSYIYDASYVKLREVAFTYSLPKKIFAGSFIKGLDLALTGRNLWIIHKNLPYADPEQGQASNTLSSSAPMVYNPNASIGYQSGAYPSVRQFAFNVKVNF